MKINMCKIGFVSWVILIFLSAIPFLRDNNGIPFFAAMITGWAIPLVGWFCDCG